MIELAVTDETNGPGTGGLRTGYGVWIRTPGGEWTATGERSAEKVRRALVAIGCEVANNPPPARVLSSRR